MASISSVLTLGLGSWGSSSLLVTAGFGVGEAGVVDYGTPTRIANLQGSSVRYVLAGEEVRHTINGANTRHEVQG